MVSSSLPPNPASFGSIEAWAANYYEFLIAQARYGQQNDPLPVLLPHKIGDERAAVDGVVMYDPVQNALVVSQDGQWRTIELDSALHRDAFGRLRVSSPYTVFDSKQVAFDPSVFWDNQEVSGSGTGSAYSANTASTVLSVGATTAGKRVRQTYMRFNYQPGKSLLVLITGTMVHSGGGAGIISGMGYYDDKNGIFFKYDEGTFKIVKRTYVTGAAVDTEVAQSAWNGDQLDGSGNSGVTLDLTKSQIFWIDFEWLGVGTVRTGVVVDGEFILCHTFNHANSLSGVYMSTPNLPIRYEIENDGTGAASELEAICSSVESEGGEEKTGIIRSKNVGTTFVNANSVGTVYALVGIRLKSSAPDAIVKAIAETVYTATNDAILWELRFNPTVAGTFTYSDVTDSPVQTAVGASGGTNTVTGGEVIRSGYQAAGGSSRAAEVFSTRHLGTDLSGVSDELVLCVTPLSSNSDVYGSLTWRETI